MDTAVRVEKISEACNQIGKLRTSGPGGEHYESWKSQTDGRIGNLTGLFHRHVW